MDYSDKVYWENRYKSLSTTKVASKSEPESQQIYEWYASFDKIKDYIVQELLRSPKKLESSVLVSGCGNSSICEDMWENGKILICFRF
jgi:hypothetical protein